MTLKLARKIGLRGEYSIIKRKAATGEVVATYDFPNLITDAGLDAMGDTDSITNNFFVGTGTAAPSTSDTQLSSYLAGKSFDSFTRPAPSGPDYESRHVIVATFTAGTATGNITEVGIGWGTGAVGHRVFSRALVLDGGGSPTTITVLADEELQLVYTLVAYPDLTDSSYSVTISGVSYAVVARASNVAANMFTGFNRCRGPNIQAVGISALRAVTVKASDYLTGTAYAAIFTEGTYVTSSYERTSTVKIAKSEGNNSIPITLVSLQPYKESSVGMLSPETQVSFAPALPKTASLALTLNLSWSWARRP